MWSKQSAASQRQQFGFRQRLRRSASDRGSKNRYLLVVSHEYTTERFMFPGYDKNHPTREQFDTALAAHGLTVIEVERSDNGPKPVMGPLQPAASPATPR